MLQVDEQDLSARAAHDGHEAARFTTWRSAALPAPIARLRESTIAMISKSVWGKGTDPSEETFPTHRAEVWRRYARDPGSRVGKLEAGEMAHRSIGDARAV